MKLSLSAKKEKSHGIIVKEKDNPKKKIESAIKNQEEELTKIRNTDRFDVRLGHAIITGDLEFRQKGVDLLIGIDMINKAYEKQYDIAVLVAYHGFKLTQFKFD